MTTNIIVLRLASRCVTLSVTVLVVVGINYKDKCSSMHTAGEYVTPTVQLQSTKHSSPTSYSWSVLST